MTQSTMLETLEDREQFRARRDAAWSRNVDYWLRGPLRHVVDVGDYIADRTVAICLASGRSRPLVVDMGFGDAWLLTALRQRDSSIQYVGLDSTHDFVEVATRTFANDPACSFELMDLEIESQRRFNADLVVNAFNFFELCDLAQGFANAATFLRPGGTLFISTIERTYLILALSRNWAEFMNNLRLYETLPGRKCAFQPIDLGDRASESLVYPSVIYSTDDYLNEARRHGLCLTSYREAVFTAKAVPKIYCHFEFSKPAT